MVTFEWAIRKDRENIKQHQVSFTEAQEAFFDPKRVIYEDIKHSTPTEARFFCIGLVHGKPCTVRYTLRDGNIRIFGAGFWRKEQKSMNEKIKIGDIVEGTFGPMRRIVDNLPTPDQLVRREVDAEKITMLLDRTTLKFFRELADAQGASYQRMIRELLKEYVAVHKEKMTA